MNEAKTVNQTTTVDAGVQITEISSIGIQTGHVPRPVEVISELNIDKPIII